MKLDRQNLCRFTQHETMPSEPDLLLLRALGAEPDPCIMCTLCFAPCVNDLNDLNNLNNLNNFNALPDHVVDLHGQAPSQATMGLKFRKEE